MLFMKRGAPNVLIVVAPNAVNMEGVVISNGVWIEDPLTFPECTELGLEYKNC